MFRKILLCILIISSLLWTAFIFSNSLATAEESSAQSSDVTEVINEIAQAVGVEQEITEGDVRNMAHFFEFLVLSVLLSSTALTVVYGKSAKGLLFELPISAISLPVCFFIACIDELLQRTSLGRASDFADVMLDTLGAFCGLVLFMLTYIITVLIFKKVKRSKTKKTD